MESAGWRIFIVLGFSEIFSGLRPRISIFSLLRIFGDFQKFIFTNPARGAAKSMVFRVMQMMPRGWNTAWPKMLVMANSEPQTANRTTILMVMASLKMGK